MTTLARCLRYSTLAGLLGFSWNAWAQEATGANSGGGAAALFAAVGVAPDLAGPLATLGLPGLLVYLAWRVGKSGGVVVQVRIPDDQLARLVAAIKYQPGGPTQP